MYHHFPLAKLLLEDGMPSLADLEAMQQRDAEKYGDKRKEANQRAKAEREKLEKMHKASRMGREETRDEKIETLEKKIKIAGGDDALDFKRAFKQLGVLGLNAKTLRKHYVELSEEGYGRSKAMNVDELVEQIEAFNRFMAVLSQTEACLLYTSPSPRDNR